MSSMRRSIGRAAIPFAAAACGSDSGGDSSGGPDPVALSAARWSPAATVSPGRPVRNWRIPCASWSSVAPLPRPVPWSPGVLPQPERH
jgi:hypothetical protein